jgi:hypothetical protein
MKISGLGLPPKQGNRCNFEGISFWLENTFITLALFFSVSHHFNKFVSYLISKKRKQDDGRKACSLAFV